MLIRTLHGLPLTVRCLTQTLSNSWLTLSSRHFQFIPAPQKWPFALLGLSLVPMRTAGPYKVSLLRERVPNAQQNGHTNTHTQSGLVVPHGSVVSRYIHYWSHRLVSPVSLCVCISTLLFHSKYHCDQNVRHYRNKTYRSLLFDNTFVMHGILSISPGALFLFRW